MQQPKEQVVFPFILTALYELLEEQAWLDLREAFIDGTFSPATEGAMTSVPRKRAKVPKSWS